MMLVQLPEPTRRENYPTIVDICEERVDVSSGSSTTPTLESFDMGDKSVTRSRLSRL